MRIRRLFAGVAVGAVCVQVSAHSSVAGYVEVSIVETETAGRPGQTFRQGQEPDEAQEQEWKQELEQEQERADTLKAAVFTGRSVRHYSDHQKFYLGKEDREGSATALETLKLIPGILVRDDEVSMMNGKGLTILLNGLPTTSASLSLLTPADIKSIDFYQNAPARYSFAGSGSMVNIITRRPGIGGSLMLNLKEAVTTPWGNNAASYRQVLKNTMIGIEYSGKPSKSGGYGIDEFLGYEAGGNRYTKEKKVWTRTSHGTSTMFLWIWSG